MRGREVPKAVHVVSGLGRSQGGPSYTVPRLCSALGQFGWDTEVLAVEDPLDPPAAQTRARLFRQAYAGIPVLSAVRLSPDLRNALVQAARGAEVVHAHGLWLMSNVYAGRVAEKCNRKLVVSPRGMLSQEALEFSAVRKKLFWQILQKRAYRSAFAWHATSEAEADDLRAFGIRAPIGIIPNGVDVPALPSPSAELPARPFPRTRTLLFLSRLHPKKGLANLLKAWAQCVHAFPGWALRIVGPDEEGHEAELKALVQQDSIAGVTFAGPVYGDAKWKEYASADVFVLPTLNENFGVCVAEALGMGIPAIVTRGAPWGGLAANRCGWWVEAGPEALAEAIREALGLTDDQRQDMGARGRSWVLRDFGWPQIAEKMSRLYSWDGSPKGRPEFMWLD